ncbi:hypothetical protein I545_6520 [Mycobacterium kansasii 662]|uniref:Uncharacterized protein n=1 Tax=Mycobacterium kansasii 662 TaxID=1299326 RepID=X7YGP5_MYCKA|nr:hypothetical protein I545_6520 [Mycobacterium kansasii 662]
MTGDTDNLVALLSNLAARPRAEYAAGPGDRDSHRAVRPHCIIAGSLMAIRRRP